MCKQDILDHCESRGITIVWKEPTFHPTLGTDGTTAITIETREGRQDLVFGGPVNLEKVMKACS